MTLPQAPPDVSYLARRWSGHGYADGSDYAFQARPSGIRILTANRIMLQPASLGLGRAAGVFIEKLVPPRSYAKVQSGFGYLTPVFGRTVETGNCLLTPRRPNRQSF